MIDLKPIFIVGSAHSGTTLLRRIIEGASDLYSSEGETLLFAQDQQLNRVFGIEKDESLREDFLKFVYCRARMRSGLVAVKRKAAQTSFEQHNFPQEHIKDLTKSTAGMNSIQTRFEVFNYIARSEGKSRWLEKTPAHVLHLAKFLPFLPEARVIELVRDPRDVLASKKIRRSEPLDHLPINVGSKSSTLKYNATLDSLSWWEAEHAGDRALIEYPEQVARIRYEDLVTNPEETTSTVAQFLGIESTALTLDVPWRNATSVSKEQAGNAISPAAVGKGLKQLTDGELAVCQLINGKSMSQLGYELKSLGFSAKLQSTLQLLSASPELARRLKKRYYPT